MFWLQLNPKNYCLVDAQPSLQMLKPGGPSLNGKRSRQPLCNFKSMKINAWTPHVMPLLTATRVTGRMGMKVEGQTEGDAQART